MSRFDVVLDNIIIGDRRGDALYNRIFIVSAYGGITDLLLENKKNGEAGVYKLFSQSNPQWEAALTLVRERMLDINKGFESLGLDRQTADDFVNERLEDIRSCLRNLRKVCSFGHFQLNEYLPMVREMVSAVGEAHSAHNSYLILGNRGIRAILVDLSGWKEVDNLPFDDKIKTSFEDIDVNHILPIVTGYTKCAEGIMSTYDRGYSEITFSKVATITGAIEGIIHKEYHLSTGDPNIVGVDNVRVIGQTNYDVADQLADLGMEAIHPRASKNMERKGIPIRVRNAFDPKHPGTLITSNDYRTEKPMVQMVTGCREILAIEVHDPDMVGQFGYDYELLSYFNRHGISYIAKNTNANTITHYVHRKTEQVEQCVRDIDHAFPSAEVRTEPVSIVSAIGCNMKVPGFLANAANALAEATINIQALDQCMRQVNMQFVVREEDFEAAIRALHRGLVENA